MQRRELLALFGGVSAATSLIMGTGAFSSTGSQRQVTVDVVGDEEAYLALSYPDTPVEADCRADVEVRIRNRTTAPLNTLQIHFASGAGVIKDVRTRGSDAQFTRTETGTGLELVAGEIPVGDEMLVVATIADFVGTDDTTLSFDVAATATSGTDGSTVSIETDEPREVTVEFDCPVQTASCPISPRAPSPPDVGDVPERDIDPSEPLTLTGTELNQDIDITAPVTIKDSAVSGNVKTRDELTLTGSTIGGNVTTEDGADIEIDTSDVAGGDVTAAGSIRRMDASSVDGSLTAGDTIDLVHDTAVVDDVDAGGAVPEIRHSDIGGDVTAGGDITELHRSAIGGNLTADDISLDHSTVCGNVNGTDITLVHTSVSEGDIDARGNLTEATGARIDGSISAGGDIETVRKSQVAGDITAHGDIGDMTGSEIGGDISAGGDIASAGISDCQIDGNIAAGNSDSSATVIIQGSTVAGNINGGDGDGNITLADSTVTEGDVTAGGTIRIQATDVTGSATSNGGDIVVSGPSTVDGDVDADGVVTVEGAVEITGDVTAREFRGDDSVVKGTVDTSG